MVLFAFFEEHRRASAIRLKSPKDCLSLLQSPIDGVPSMYPDASAVCYGALVEANRRHWLASCKENGPCDRWSAVVPREVTE